MISWFSRRDERKEGRRPSRTSHQPGVAVGPAIFRPKRVNDIREDLRGAVGKVVELVFVTVAGPDERWAGQNIYMERPGPRSVLRGAHPGRLAHGAPVVLLADGSPVELEGVRR